MKKNSISRRADVWLPPLLLAAGILLRAFYLWEYASAVNFDVPVGPDINEYDQRAREILSGRFLPAVPDIHGPFYPLFLAFLYLVSGSSIPVVRAGQLLLNFLCWPALERLLFRQGVSFAPRMVFLGLGMLYVIPVFHQAELISESLLLPILTVSLWMLELAATEFDPLKRNIRSGAAGVAAGLAAVTHPLTLTFAAAVFLYGLCRKARKEALVFLAGVFLVVLPVVGIKSLHYGRLTGIQQNGGFNFWLGNDPVATGGCWLRPGPVWRKLHREADAEAVRRGISSDRVWIGRTLHFWRNDPVRGIYLFLKKAVMVCYPAELPAGADAGALLCRTKIMRCGAFLSPLILFFALWGVVCAAQKKAWIPPGLWLLAAALYAGQVLTVTSGRYRLTMLPAVLFFSACGLTSFDWKKYFYLPLLALFLQLPLVTGSFSEGKYEAAALLGEAAWRKGDAGQALRDLAFARTGYHDPARISNQIGMLLEHHGDFAGAERAYREAAAGDPDAMESWMNLANLLARFPARHAQAQNFYAEALRRAPKSSVLHYNYAVFLNGRGKTEDAEKELLRALECDDTQHRAYNLLGVIALRSGRPEAAEKCFAAALALAPQETGYRKNLEITRNGIRGRSNR